MVGHVCDTDCVWRSENSGFSLKKCTVEPITAEARCLWQSTCEEEFENILVYGLEGSVMVGKHSDEWAAPAH